MLQLPITVGRGSLLRRKSAVSSPSGGWSKTVQKFGAIVKMHLIRKRDKKKLWLHFMLFVEK